MRNFHSIGTNGGRHRLVLALNMRALIEPGKASPWFNDNQDVVSAFLDPGLVD